MEICRNCSQRFEGRYCPACGQSTEDLHRPVWTFVKDAVDNIFGADSRILKTIPALLIRPGRMSREYWQGKRHRYSSPVRLYLIASLVSFLIISMGSIGLVTVHPAQNDGEAAMPRVSIATAGLDSSAEVSIWIFAPKTPDQEDLSAVRDALDELENRENAKPTTSWMVPLLRAVAGSLERPEAFNAAINERLAALILFQILVIALIMSLLYVGSGRVFLEHAVFALHLQSFALVLLGATLLIAQVLPERFVLIPFFLSLLLQAAYALIAMKTAYAKGWIMTTLRWLVFQMLNFILVVIIFTSVVLFAVYDFTGQWPFSPVGS